MMVLHNTIGASGTTPSTANAPQSRMASLRSTTLNFLKGGNRGQKTQLNTKKSEIAVNGSTGAANTMMIVARPLEEVTETAKEPERPPTRLYTPSSAVEISRSRMTSPTLTDSSPFAAIEARTSANPIRPTSPAQYQDAEEYILNNQSQGDHIDTVPTNDNTPLSPIGMGAASPKKAGGKLKMVALSILRRKSNPNIRKALEDEHNDNTRRRDSMEPSARNAGRSGTSKSRLIFSPTLTTQSFPQGSQAPNRRPTRLHKNPPPELMRQRRGQVVSGVFEESLAPSESSRPPGWGALERRPSSSQSSAPGGTALPADDCVQLSADTTMITGGNAPGGLYPRPSSLKRANWSGDRIDSPNRQRLTSGTPPGSAGRAIEGNNGPARPLSFSGLNTYPTMKITDAASVEFRVRELENQVASIQEFINQLKSSVMERRSSQRSTDRSQSLGSPFREESSFGKRPETATTISTFRHVDYSELNSEVSASVTTSGGPVDWRSVARGGPPSPTQASGSSFISTETMNLRQRAFDALRSVPSQSTDTSQANTNASMSTITPNHDRTHERSRDSGHDYHRCKTPPPPGVTMEEHAAALAQIKRERRARKRLEGQVANLQEQMSLVLHRQLIQSERQLMQHEQQFYHRNMSPTITGTSFAGVSAAPSGVSSRPDYQGVRRKASSEVPTPDLTPPRVNGDMMLRSQLFSTFDSTSGNDSDSDDNRSFYIGADDEDEIWATPAEDARVLQNELTRTHDVRGGHLAPPLSLSPQRRTMSISQITEKASAASRLSVNRV